VFENAKNYNDVKTDIYKTACKMLDKKVAKLFGFDVVKQKLIKNKNVTAEEMLNSDII
jgi:hypothetical protein